MHCAPPIQHVKSVHIHVCSTYPACEISVLTYVPLPSPACEVSALTYVPLPSPACEVSAHTYAPLPSPACEVSAVVYLDSKEVEQTKWSSPSNSAWEQQMKIELDKVSILCSLLSIHRLFNIAVPSHAICFLFLLPPQPPSFNLSLLHFSTESRS